MSKAFDWVRNLFHKPQGAALPARSPVEPAPPPEAAPSPPPAPQYSPVAPQKTVQEQMQSGGPPVSKQNIEAMKAWVGVNEYLIKWGLQRSKPAAPAMSAQTEYALRRIGGLANFRATPVRLWIEAYNEAPIVDVDQNNANTDRVIDGNVRMNQLAIEKKP